MIKKGMLIMYSYYGRNDYRDYLVLQHHGILGQKWGKKNGPPYPLDGSDHSASEKKAGWRSSLGGGRNESRYSKPKVTSKDLRDYKYQQQQEQEKKLPKEKSSKNEQRKELTSEEKAARKELAKKIIIASAVSVGVGVGLYLAYKHGSVEDMAKLGDKITPETAKEIMLENLDEKVLPKGAEIHRMVSESNIDFSKAKNPIYAAYKERDVRTYRAFLRDHGDSKKQMYDVAFQAAKDIKMPTRKKAEEIFNELWEKDPSYKKELEDTLADTYQYLMKKQNPVLARQFGEKWLKDAAAMQARMDLETPEGAFNKGVYAIVRQRGDAKKLIDEFAKRGYDALEDYHDIDDGLSKAPIILFNPSSDVVKTGEKAITDGIRRLDMKWLRNKGVHIPGVM